MRSLSVTHTPEFGGAEEYLMDLVRRIDDSIECQILCLSEDFYGEALKEKLNLMVSKVSIEGVPEIVVVERLWKSLKYEEVYLHAYDTVGAAQQGLERYLTFYNQTRPHRALDGKTPEQVYCDNLMTRRTAA